MKVIKNSLKLLKQDPAGCFTVAFAWLTMLFVTIMAGQIIGFTALIYVLLMIPSTISIRFIYLTYITGKPITYSSFKIGFVTYTSSIKLYFRMIVNALVAFLTTFFISSIIYAIVFRIIEPKVYEQLISASNTKEMIELMNGVKWMSLYEYITLGVSFAVYYLFKLRSNFLPYIAFQAPIDARSAKQMGSMMLNGNFLHYILLNASFLLFASPVAFGGYKLYEYLYDIKIYTSVLSLAITLFLCFIVLSPFVAFYGLANAEYYRLHSEPFQKEINGALDKLLRELKQLEEETYKEKDKDIKK